MKTLFGAIVVDGRGKLGGHVASKNRHGSYLELSSPSQPASQYSANVRARFTTNLSGMERASRSFPHPLE